MKTKCPNCSQLWNIEAGEQDQTIECFYCKSQFNAAPYSVPVPNEPPDIPFQPSQTAQPVEEIGTPGMIWYLLGTLIGIIGIISGLFQINRGGLAIIISAVMFWLIASAVGGVLNRLERIAHHTEKLSERRKINNP